MVSAPASLGVKVSLRVTTTGGCMTVNSVPAAATPPEIATAFSIFEGLELAGVTPVMIARFCDASATTPT